MKNRFDALKEQAQAAGPKVLALYDKEVKAMAKTNRDLKKKAAEYSEVGRKKWKELKANVKHDAKGIGKTVKALLKTKG